MKILVIGSGGREHALTWKLQQSSAVDRIFCAPGNAGTALVAENVAVVPNDFAALDSIRERERDWPDGSRSG